MKPLDYEEQYKNLINQAELIINTWESKWTNFISPQVAEKALPILGTYQDLYVFTDGGYPRAELKRFYFQRSFENIDQLHQISSPLLGIKIEGNFLFDKASINDFITKIIAEGILIEELGDIWLTGDRGAELVCTPEVANRLDQHTTYIRDIKIRFKISELKDLRFPQRAYPKKISTTEASTRLDAIASAGFGLSIAKVNKKIKDGKVKKNWEPMIQPSHQIKEGDSIQLENRGILRVLKISKTKKERWRIELIRE